MKKIILTLSFILTLISCKNVADGEYEVTGTIKGVKTGTVILEKQNELAGMGFTPVDTVKIVDGKFSIKGKAGEPEMHFIQVEKYQGKVPFILEEGSISVEVDKDSIFKSKISGTYNNDEFNTFNQETAKLQKGLQKKMMDFQMKNMAKINEARKTKDTAIINSLTKEFKAIQKVVPDYMYNYADKHPKAYISLLITKSKLNNPDNKLEDVEKSFNKLDESLKKTKEGKKLLDNIKEAIRKQKEVTEMKTLNVGEKAPDFSAKSPDGKMISLKESLGKVTLIDFWASWCGPCRSENPNVVATYNQLHSKGLNIIGVSLDEKLEKWQEAIAKDKITWTQVSNLKGWQDPIAKSYGVMQIPSTFLVDANGTIIAKDLRGDELKKKIQELLSK